jgi:hypothetical protein
MCNTQQITLAVSIIRKDQSLLSASIKEELLPHLIYPNNKH